MRRAAVRKERTLTFRILYYWGKLIGINPLTLTTSNNLKFSYFSLFYGCLLIINYSYIFYNVFVERRKIVYSDETPISKQVHIFLISIYYVQTITTWFMCGFYQNRIKLIVKKFVKLETTSRKVYITEDYVKRFRQLGIQLIAINAAHCTSMVLNSMLPPNDVEITAFLWLCYSFLRLTIYNTETVFIWILLIIRHKFHQLNDQMHIVIQKNYVRNSSCNLLLLSDRINIIALLHRELRDIIYRTNKLFALPFFLEMMTQVTSLTLNLYVVCGYTQTHRSFKGIDYVTFAIISHWVFIPTAVIFIISHLCNSTINEANKTGNILHATVNYSNHFGGAQDAAKINMLSLELLQNQVNITLYGFFDMDYSLFRRITTVATMYLMIMWQF